LTNSQAGGVTNLRGQLPLEGQLWFKVAVSTVDSEGTVPHQSQRHGTNSSNKRKTVHRELKKF